MGISTLNNNIIITEEKNILGEVYYKTSEGSFIVVRDNFLQTIGDGLIFVGSNDVVAELVGDYTIDKDGYIIPGKETPELVFREQYVEVGLPQKQETNSGLIFSVETQNLGGSGVPKSQYFVEKYDNYGDIISGYTMIAPINVRSFVVLMEGGTKKYNYTYKSTITFLSEEPIIKTENKKGNETLAKYLI